MTIKKRHGFNALLFATSVQVLAAEPQGLDADFLRDAGYWEAGPVRLYPALSTAFGHDDNIFESAVNEVDSAFSRVIPEMTAVLPINAGFCQLGAQADDLRFENSSEDNFTGATLYGRSVFEANHRNRFNVDARYIKSHDPRGTGLTEGFDPANPGALDEPDEFTDKRASARYEYGATGAKGRLRIGTDYLDHTYGNHRERTRFFDREEYGASGAFLWRVGGRTSLLLEGRERRIDYSHRNPASPGLDSSQHSAFLGAELDPVGATSGSARVGYSKKEFDDDERVDGSNTVWEVNANWAPRTYSRFQLTVDRAPNETNGIGDYIDSRSARLLWTHDWTSRVGTQLAASHVKRSYQESERESRTKSMTAGVSYQMRRWFTLRLDGAWHDRSSNVESLDFERSRYWVTAEFTL